MNKKLRALCVERGMPADLDDEAAQEWLVENPEKIGARTPAPPTAPPQPDAKSIVDELDARARQREEARELARKTHRAKIDDLCDLLGIFDSRSRYYDCETEEGARNLMKEDNAERAKKGLPRLGVSRPRVTGEGRDAFRKAAMSSMIHRVFRANGGTDADGGRDVSQKTRAAVLPESERAQGSAEFDDLPLTELARRCLVIDGCDENEVRRLDKFALATAAMRSPEAAGIERRDGSAFHATSSFAYLTENTMNKSMRAGYMEARTTYQKVCRIGDPVPDFKKKSIYTTSAVGNLTVWPDGTKPNLATFMDYKDSYGVEAYANMLEFTWQLFVNDDMSVVIKSPYKLGDACRRTINAYFWQIVTSNPTLADGQALFLASATGNRKKANYISSGLAVTVAALSALENLMRQQVGQNTREGAAGPDILNIEPKYLVTPTAIKNVAAAIVKSIADPASSNSNVHNPFSNALELISEPLLDANSAQAWYLAADPNLVDGIELSFLQGFEQPRTWSGVEEKTLTRWWAIAQVWGGKAIDHRGWAKQAGA